MRALTLAPEALIANCGRAEERQRDADRWLVEPDLPVNVEKASAWLAQTEPAVEGSGGHDHTYQTAAMLRDRGISQDRAVELMGAHWNARCSPPWEPEELSVVVGNAYRYAKQPAGCEAWSRKAAIVAGATTCVPDEVPEADHVEPAADDPMSSNRFACAEITGAAVTDVMEVPFSIEDLYPEVAVAFLYGDPGSFKTTGEIHRLMCRKYGLPYAGHESKPGNSVMFAGEAPAVVQMIVKAWEQHYNPEGRLKPQENFTLVTKCPLLVSEWGDVTAYLRSVESRFGKIDEILVDHIARAAEGSLTDDAVARAYMGRAEQLRDDFECSFMSIAHKPYGTDKLFGSIFFLARADLVWKASRVGDQLQLLNKRQKGIGEWPDLICFNSVSVPIPGATRPGFTLVDAAAPRRTQASQATVLFDVVMKRALFEHWEVDPQRVLTSQELAQAMAEDGAIKLAPKTLANQISDLVKAGEESELCRRFLKSPDTSRSKGSHTWGWDGGEPPPVAAVAGPDDLDTEIPFNPAEEYRK